MLSCDLSLITMHISDCCQFSDIHISQGSVATYSRCGGIFKYDFVANLSVTLPVKEFWKSVNIWGSYGQEFSVLFFDTQCIYLSKALKVSKTVGRNNYCYPTAYRKQPRSDRTNAYSSEFVRQQTIRTRTNTKQECYRAIHWGSDTSQTARKACACSCRTLNSLRHVSVIN